MVAETVLDSATVELSVPVATPLAFVVAAGCVSVFPVPVATPSAVVGPLGCVSVFAVPVAASTTVAPAIAFPNPSLAVTVIVDAPVPAAIGDVAATVDCAADTAPGFTTTVAVATPFASVVPAGCVSVFPVPVAASTTVAP